jgi:hypothetical protein
MVESLLSLNLTFSWTPYRNPAESKKVVNTSLKKTGKNGESLLILWHMLLFIHFIVIRFG